MRVRRAFGRLGANGEVWWESPSIGDTAAVTSQGRSLCVSTA